MRRTFLRITNLRIPICKIEHYTKFFIMIEYKYNCENFEKTLSFRFLSILLDSIGITMFRRVKLTSNITISESFFQNFADRPRYRVEN